VETDRKKKIVKERKKRVRTKKVIFDTGCLTTQWKDSENSLTSVAGDLPLFTVVAYTTPFGVEFVLHTFGYKRPIEPAEQGQLLTNNPTNWRKSIE
jgi:hypothetical protein